MSLLTTHQLLIVLIGLLLGFFRTINKTKMQKELERIKTEIQALNKKVYPRIRLRCALLKQDGYWLRISVNWLLDECIVLVLVLVIE